MFIAVTYRDVILSEHDAATVYNTYFILLNNVGTVDAHETRGRQKFLHCLHAHERQDRFGRILLVDFEIVFQPLYVQNFTQFDLHQLILALYEDALNLFLGLLQQFKPLHSFVGSLQKVDVGDGFQQVVQRIDFVAVYGILVEGGGKDNAGAGIDHLRKFQSVQFGHLDVEEKQVDVLLGQLLDGLYGTGVFTDQLQKRGLVDVAFQLP